MRHDVIVIGAERNGLGGACYLARAGVGVLVLEAADRIGGATHTAPTIPSRPDYHFDTCAVVHNMINKPSGSTAGAPGPQSSPRTAHPAGACWRWRSACWRCLVVVVVARTVLPAKRGSTRARSAI